MHNEIDSLVALVTKPGVSGVSWRGTWYPANDGRVFVPAEAVAELTRAIHGNTVAPVDEVPKRDLAQTLHLKHGGKRA